ncbi:MAG: SEC-C metal-binding domain-containing protein [Planctomycetota bacterium]
MGFVGFRQIEPVVAARELRSLQLGRGDGLPAGTYALFEHYCVEPGCDCRRVVIAVMTEHSPTPLAWIDFGFDRNAPLAGPFLDPLMARGEHAEALLDLVSWHLERDPAYVARLERHYSMVKDAVADPTHRIHSILPPELIRGKPLMESIEPLVSTAAKIGRNDPCCCGSGRKFKKCCFAVAS